MSSFHNLSCSLEGNEKLVYELVIILVAYAFVITFVWLVWNYLISRSTGIHLSWWATAGSVVIFKVLDFWC